MIARGSRRDIRRRAVRAMLAAGMVGAALLTTVGAAGMYRAATGSHAAATSRSAAPAVENQAPPRLGPSRVVEDDDVGDPSVLAVAARAAGNATAEYVLYWTTDWQSNVPTAVSADLIHWRRVADSLPVLPSWAENSATMTWGPAVRRVGSKWVLYYSTEVAASHLECIGRAVAARPTGPFLDTSRAPLVCQRSLGGDIDPSVVTDPNGRSSLLWKNDGNAIGAPVGIWEQPLTPDGLSVTATPTRLLVADQAWEHGIVEGPAMLAASRGGWWLFYAGGTWQSDTYDTGVAWCATLTGPCRKPLSAPMLASAPTAVSPGGFDTFVDVTGKLWASYSAFPDRPASREAALAEDRVLEIAPVLSH